jgi:hypothetical protein
MRIAQGFFLLPIYFVLVGCGFVPSPAPSSSRPIATIPSPPSQATAGSGSGGPVTSEPAPSAPDLAKLIGPWQASPLPLGDPQIAVISDACATAAREQLGEAEANLPTTLVDARGIGVATAILSDDPRAIECLVRIAGDGAAHVDGVIRLAPSATGPAEESTINLTSLLTADDVDGGRTLAIGRAGPNAARVEFVVGDGIMVVATRAGGWFSAWWPGSPHVTAIRALDAAGTAVATLAPPTAEIDGRLGAASWWLDPAFPKPTADDVTINAMVLEEACASGKTPDGRIEPPMMDFSDAAITVTIGIRPLPGDQDCQGNAPFPLTFDLDEPLAGRTLLDGGEVPPRDASKPPVG